MKRQKFNNKVLKNILIFYFLLFNLNQIFAYRGYSRHSYEDIGLPSGDEVGKCLAIALPLLIVGILICYAVWWNKSAQTNQSSISKGKNNFGCFGMLLILGGLVFLLPLLAWVEFTVNYIIGIGILLFVVISIIVFIYSRFKK